VDHAEMRSQVEICSKEENDDEKTKLYYQYYDLINPNLVVFLIKEGKTKFYL